MKYPKEFEMITVDNGPFQETGINAQFTPFTLGLHSIHIFIFMLWSTACGILVPQPGMESVPAAVGVRCPNHWITQEVPGLYFKNTFTKNRVWKGDKIWVGNLTLQWRNLAINQSKTKVNSSDILVAGTI